MKKTNLILPALIIGLVSVSIGTFNTFASQGDYTKTSPNYTAERHVVMQKAFTTNDYESWKTQMELTNSGKRVLSVINKDNFAKYIEFIYAAPIIIENGDNNLILTPNNLEFETWSLIDNNGKPLYNNIKNEEIELNGDIISMGYPSNPSNKIYKMSDLKIKNKMIKILKTNYLIIKYKYKNSNENIINY